jgi:S1-C subfamily serine protease
VQLPQRLRVKAGLTQEAGVRIVEVQPGSPADTGGLQPSDVILGVDGEVVTGIDDIARLLDGTKIGQRVSVRVLRDASAIKTVVVVPAERLPER